MLVKPVVKSLFKPGDDIPSGSGNASDLLVSWRAQQVVLRANVLANRQHDQHLQAGSIDGRNLRALPRFKNGNYVDESAQEGGGEHQRRIAM